MGGEVLSERSGDNASSSYAGWYAVQILAKDVCAVVEFIDSISTHTVGTTVEVWRIEGVLGRLAPVPILT